jgi:hypothetical protein
LLANTLEIHKTITPPFSLPSKPPPLWVNWASRSILTFQLWQPA